MKAAGHIMEGQAAYEAGKFNRRVAETNAVNAERDGTVDEARIRDAARFAMGAQVAAQASGGFQAGTGSAIDALKESAVNSAVAQLQARRQARSAATASRTQGAIAYAAGRNAQTAGYMNAAKSLIDDYGKAAAAGG
jgi:hypothetical protein